MIKISTYCKLVDTYLELELKNLDPSYDSTTIYNFSHSGNINQSIPFACFKYTHDLITCYRRKIKWTDDFDLVNEAYRLIFKFMEYMVNGVEIDYSNLYTLFTNQIKSEKRKRKYFDINETTVKLLNGK